MTSPNLAPQVIAWARRQVGTTETGTNKVRFWDLTKPSFQGQPWCGAFVTAAWLAVGVDIRPHVNPYYVPALVAWAKKIGAWSTSEHEDGDLVCYTFGLPGRFPHVGLVWRDEDAAGYRAIEGNTSSGSSGSQANGGGVYIRYRGRSSIGGYVRMSKVIEHYGLGGGKAGAPAPGEDATGALVVDGRWGRRTTQELQERLKVTSPGLAVDGRMGPLSWCAFQHVMGTPEDGVVSHQSRKADTLGNGIAAGGWDYDGPGAAGSTLIRAFQRFVDPRGDVIKADGIVGPVTVKALQLHLNASPVALTSRKAA